ncbi:MAG: hypothetical protein [Sclerotinia sclerotiorum narnavirus 1]|nr:MAG: hypothetical protein [Sclerotinia sclerotiorum narnavirus 1]
MQMYASATVRLCRETPMTSPSATPFTPAGPADGEGTQDPAPASPAGPVTSSSPPSGVSAWFAPILTASISEAKRRQKCTSYTSSTISSSAAYDVAPWRSDQLLKISGVRSTVSNLV